MAKMIVSESSITVQVRLRFTDFWRANRLYRASTSNDHIGRLLIGFLSLFLGGCYLVFLAVQPIRSHNGIDLSFPAAFMSILIGIILILDLIPLVFSRLVFKQNNQLYSEPYQAIFDENGISVQRPNMSTKYEWNVFNMAVEGRDEFILIYKKNLYFAISKNCFESEKETEIFRGMLQRKVTLFRQILKLPLDIQWKNAIL